MPFSVRRALSRVGNPRMFPVDLSWIFTDCAVVIFGLFCFKSSESNNDYFGKPNFPENIFKLFYQRLNNDQRTSKKKIAKRANEFQNHGFFSVVSGGRLN